MYAGIGTEDETVLSRPVPGSTGARSAQDRTKDMCVTWHKVTRVTGSPYPLPRGLVTPINVDNLDRLLLRHPCVKTRNFLVSGFRFGFDIGFRGVFHTPNARPRNLRSARDNERLVSEAINKELVRGHTSGPFPSAPFPDTHCSPIGSAPKPDGSVRLILDLSSPRGDSVNDGISQEEFACTYSKFDEAVRIIQHLGRGSYMGKIDIKHAFRVCPVRPCQWPLLCFQWKGSFYTDTRLPFGSRSSPFIFNTFAHAVAWMALTVMGISFLIHYLDDYFLAHWSRARCNHDMTLFLELCKCLGVPIAEDKLIGPSQYITYLGIEIDSVNMRIRLPADKLADVRCKVHSLVGKDKIQKGALLSLIGSLSFASKVVKPGRMLLRRLIDLSTTVTSKHFYVTVNSCAREDIAWWDKFLPQWNGVSIFQATGATSETLALYTDASDLGFGGVFGHRWFSGSWGAEWRPPQTHINARELFAVWVAVATWGHSMINTEITIFSDNRSVVDSWCSGVCTDPLMLRLMRCIFFFAASNNINILMRHIPGYLNVNADLLSRLQVREFLRSNPSSIGQQDFVAADVRTAF